MPGITLILDCNDPEAVVGFWTAALGYRRIYDAHPYIVLGPDPDGFCVCQPAVPGDEAARVTR